MKVRSRKIKKLKILAKIKTARIICLFKLDILRFFMMFEFPTYKIKQFEKSDLFWGNLFWDTAPNGRAKFKHCKESENVKFEETSNAVSILEYELNQIDIHM